MSNVIQLVPNNTPESENSVEEFLKEIAVDTDQIIFLRISKEGNFTIGNTPLDVKDLIYMSHQLQRYINHVLEEDLPID